MVNFGYPKTSFLLFSGIQKSAKPKIKKYKIALDCQERTFEPCRQFLRRLKCQKCCEWSLFLLEVEDVDETISGWLQID